MSHNPHPCNHHNCVCEVVRKIVCAQKEVSDRDKNKHCSSSCENSIKQLLSSHSKSKNMNTTIPFVLFNKGSLKPFIASGVHKKEKKDAIMIMIHLLQSKHQSCGLYDLFHTAAVSRLNYYSL